MGQGDGLVPGRRQSRAVSRSLEAGFHELQQPGTVIHGEYLLFRHPSAIQWYSTYRDER
jgi:hypothetical protein